VTASIHVLDVGHGNCALVLGEDWTLMVDACASASVLQSVIHLELDRLDAVVISHRDLDHAGGLVPLLSRQELEIGAIYIGADAAKNPTAPETANLLAALDDAKGSGRCLVSRDLDDAFDAQALSGAGVDVEILAPTFKMAMTGPKGASPSGGTITSNTVSAVLRVTLDGGLKILLPGDMDEVALNDLQAKGTDLSADVLVFPHHGSLGAVSDEQAFAATLTAAVQAQTVLFSVGRGVRARPTADVLRGICLVSNADLADKLAHLTELPAAGRSACRSCAGSMTFGPTGLEAPDPEAHQEYITAVADTPMCRLLRP
jgi:beta-lactamase superfamily II metal-dependent hydrolase